MRLYAKELLEKGRTGVRAITLLGLAVGGLLVASQALAFQLEGPNWAYMRNPMGEPWVICPDRMPAEAVQRIKDAAATWNYERFQFTFASEACLSNGVYPLMNGVNQIDFGPLRSGALAETVFVFIGADTIECDLRFNSAVNWYTGTGTPATDQFDLWSVALHELGHCLGLAHEDSVMPLPVMRSRLQVGAVVRELTDDDIAGRNAIYSQPQPFAIAAPSNNGGGGGGCSLSPATPAMRPAWLAVLGNMALPVVVLLALRAWSRRLRRLLRRPR